MPDISFQNNTKFIYLLTFYTIRSITSNLRASKNQMTIFKQTRDVFEHCQKPHQCAFAQWHIMIFGVSMFLEEIENGFVKKSDRIIS